MHVSGDSTPSLVNVVFLDAVCISSLYLQGLYPPILIICDIRKSSWGYICFVFLYHLTGNLSVKNREFKGDKTN